MSYCAGCAALEAQLAAKEESLRIAKENTLAVLRMKETVDELLESAEAERDRLAKRLEEIQNA